MVTSSTRLWYICSAVLFLIYVLTSPSLAHEKNILLDSVDEMHWTVLFQAKIAALHDSLATIGVRPDATQDYDPLYDKPRPPSPPGDWVEVYFPHTGGNWPTLLGTRFAVDITQPTLPSWLMEVETTLDTGTLTLYWDTSSIHTLPQMYGIFMRDSTAHVTINLRTQNSYSFFYTTDRIFTLWTKFDVINVPISPDWNMVSLPCAVFDSSVSTLFPTANSSAFDFDGGYQVSSSLERAIGYWLRFKTGDTVVIGGFPDSWMQIPVSEGWNLVGSLYKTVAAPSGGLIISHFFGYQNGYYPTDTLSPGKGYWVKTSAAGMFLLGDSSSPAENKSGIQIPKENISLLIKNSAQSRQQLYIVPKSIWHSSPSFSEMPPKPPDGIFDARFSSQKFVESYELSSSDQQLFSIEIQSSNYPIVVNTHISDPHVNRIEVTSDGSVWHEVPYSIDDPQVHDVSVRIILSNNRPEQFNLEQNFPNPFNPSTTIRYSIPEPADVQLLLFDVLGREVAVLTQSKQQAGDYNVEVNIDLFGLSSGIYLYRLDAIGLDSGVKYQESKKLLYLK